MFKHWVHEGGIGTPFVVHCPGAPAGSAVHEPCHVVDIMPTCLEAAGVSYPSEYDGPTITPTEGESLFPLIDTSEERFDRALFWEQEGNKAVRIGSWKLVRKFPGGGSCTTWSGTGPS